MNPTALRTRTNSAPGRIHTVLALCSPLKAAILLRMEIMIAGLLLVLCVSTYLIYRVAAALQERK